MGEQTGPTEAVGAGQNHWHVQPAQADGALVGCCLALPHPIHALHEDGVCEVMLDGCGLGGGVGAWCST